MEMQQERPPAYEPSQRDGADTLSLPAVPTHALTSPPTTDRLPGIRSFDFHETHPRACNVHPPRASVDRSPPNRFENPQWSLPPPNGTTLPGVHDAVVPRHTSEPDIGSPMDTASIASAASPRYDGGRRGRSLQVEDPSVLMAAEALSGLGNPDFARSPRNRSLPLPHALSSADEHPPLLSLITSNHPWLGGTINGSISAYNATKGYSPRVVKYGAELIERNIGSPVVNTVSSVGRRTGIEKNLRRYLGEHRRPSDLEDGPADSARKRARVETTDSDTMDYSSAYATPRTRMGSQSSSADTLPAYDDHRESSLVLIDPSGKPLATQASASQSQQDRRVAWSTQLIMTTSGLGVALSNNSLKSLKFCLGYLRSATKHIDGVMHALKLLLDEYDAATRTAASRRSRSQSQSSDTTAVDGGTMDVDDPDRSAAEDEEVRRIAEKMKTLSSDIWKTLENVVKSVSRYTGGALPQNASQVVRTQLLSVPQRWMSAMQSTNAQNGEQQGDEVRGAQRMVAFAKEGLDMMGQITMVVDGTVESAETWLGRMGRRRPQDQEGEGSQAGAATFVADVKQEQGSQGVEADGHANGNPNGNGVAHGNEDLKKADDVKMN